MARPIAFWLAVLALGLWGANAMAESPFLVGAAWATINPPTGAFIAGDRLNRRFTGVHDDLFAKAVAVSDGSETVALLTVDCLGLTYPTIQQIRVRAVELVSAIDLPAARIVVSSTHIHNGPDIIGIYGADRMQTGLDPAYMKRLVEACASALAQAVERLVPVSARYAETVHGEGWVKNVCEAAELDRSVTILQFLDAEGKSVATLTNFACHPTILDGVHDVVSADWVGGFYRAMSASLPGEHLFFQGAIGGWVQPVKGDRSFDLANRYGGGLSEAVIAALAASQPLPGKEIAFASDTLRLPLENAGWAQLSKMGIVDRELTDSVLTEVAWFRIGAAEFATHPGETAPAYAMQTKAMMRTDGPKFVLGLSLDALGYVLKPVYFDEGVPYPDADYLTSMSVGRDTGPLMMSALRELIPAP